MKTSFDRAFVKVIKAEGGYVRDKDDKGGETYLGIARRYHKNSVMWKYIDEIKSKNPTATYARLTSLLKKDKRIDYEVKCIYKTQYWDKLRCDKINSQKIAEQLFDMAVNAGISTAVKLMQRLMGTFESGYVTNEFIDNLNNYVRRRYINKI